MSGAGGTMSKGTKIGLWIVVLLGIVVVWRMAYDSGYTLGSDIAKRENAEEGR